MGFTKEQVQTALEKSGFDEDKALDTLLGGWSIYSSTYILSAYNKELENKVWVSDHNYHIISLIRQLILISCIMTTKKSPFIEGFKEPTLSKNSFLTLADVRGDGEGKLVIWSEEQNQLIVYKGSDRELEKACKLKNVSGIIQYQDEERNAQSVIGLSSENGFYIFRSLAESFRLRVPDIYADTEEQLIWTQYEQDPNKIRQ